MNYIIVGHGRFRYEFGEKYGQVMYWLFKKNFHLTTRESFYFPLV